MKKILFIIATLFMWLNNASAYDFGVDGIYYNITSASNLEVEVTYYSSSHQYSGDIVIPQNVTYNGKQYTVTGIGEYAFNGEKYYSNYNLKSVKLPSSVTTIGDHAFYGCTKLTEIELPSSVTTIGKYAFYGCSSILSMIIPASVTKMGYYCLPYSLKELIMLPINHPSYTETSSGNYVFGEFSGEVIVPNKAKYAADSYWKKYTLVEMATPDATEFTYNGQTPEVTWTNNLKAYTMKMQTVLNKDAGTYSESIKTEYYNGNELYFTVEIPYDYTINKAPLSVKVNDASREYGDDNPAFTCTYSGFVNGESESALGDGVQLATTATKESDAGTYPITATVAAKNYEASTENGTLTVTKAPLTAKIGSATREYGDNNPEFTVQYYGLKNNETAPKYSGTMTLTTAATKSSAVGSYAITASNTAATNYDVTFANGTLTVTPAALKVKADALIKTYKDDNPTFSYTCTGKKFTTDKFTTTPTVTCSATKSSPVGVYDIKVSGGVMPNYDITYEDATLTVQKRSLAISAKSYTKKYGEDNPEFAVTYSGFASDENEDNLTVKPTITCTATKDSPIGTYPITVYGAESKNYDISYKNATLVIGKRTLLVSTKDYTRKYGEDNPMFEIEYDGFVDGEDENALTTKPKASCSATKTSDVGTYSISLSGGVAENYSLSYTNGKLTILQAEQELTWNQEFTDVKVGDQIELLASTTSGLQITYVISDETIVSTYNVGDRVFIDCLAPGTVTIRATQDGNANYQPAVRVVKTVTVAPSSGISEVRSDEGTTNTNIYDKMGRKVSRTVKGNIYIQNGKKFIAR